MKVVRPAQIPRSPQPNTSDSQISGRNPTSALINGGAAHEGGIPGTHQHAVEGEDDAGEWAIAPP